VIKSGHSRNTFTVEQCYGMVALPFLGKEESSRMSQEILARAATLHPSRLMFVLDEGPHTSTGALKSDTTLVCGSCGSDLWIGMPAGTDFIHSVQVTIKCWRCQAEVEMPIKNALLSTFTRRTGRLV